MVAVVQLVEHQVVILDVAGSSPVSHPAGGRVFLPSHLLHSPESLHPHCNADRSSQQPSQKSEWHTCSYSVRWFAGTHQEAVGMQVEQLFAETLIDIDRKLGNDPCVIN
jgi:hypothetical protein